MPAVSNVSVTIKSDAQGHWVEWQKQDASGTLGPYLDAKMAENVRATKERELIENEGSIDDASSFSVRLG